MLSPRQTGRQSKSTNLQAKQFGSISTSERNIASILHSQNDVFYGIICMIFFIYGIISLFFFYLKYKVVTSSRERLSGKTVHVQTRA